ncbi:LegC2/C7 family Dot/Icm T4SS effector [Legionella brunensis]|uniref:Inclusion membrane protein A n=1 Tax=Legionella brunensis TaxID=29422 RepID=A0A0W0SNM4_9GAMM|nr:LegC2/C7 family Dot/Icm T4SS effector [Legionella brunensis]KTC84860.1 inclusion membrane protein A [Legionella brunensis]
MPLIERTEETVSPEKSSIELKPLNHPPIDPNGNGLEKPLVELNVLEKPSLEPNTLPTQPDDLAQIAISQQQLGQIKQSLGTIIDTMQQNDSLISRAANFWGELPLWQKIVGGIVLTVPTLAAGIAAHVGILLAISGVTVIAYTASGIVLDDHHTCNKNIADRLKQGIFSLADILEITIAALDKIRENLAKEIDRFRDENKRLTNTVDELGYQVESLSNQVELLIATEELLRKSKDELEHTTEQLQKTVQDNDKLLKANHDELTQVKKEYATNRTQLSEKVKELAEVRTSMSLEIQKTKLIAATLKGTVDTLSDTVIEDSEQRKGFQERLETFLKDEKSSFASIADRICKTETELSLVKSELVFVKEELNRSNERYEQLLLRQEQQVDRLEKLDIRVISSTPEASKPTSANQFGFYSPKNKPSALEKVESSAKKAPYSSI